MNEFKKEVLLAEYKKESEKKILRLNNKIFKISVMSICAIILLLTALMLNYTSAFDEGYKNVAKDTQKIYESIIQHNNE